MTVLNDYLNQNQSKQQRECVEDAQKYLVKSVQEVKVNNLLKNRSKVACFEDFRFVIIHLSNK